MAAVAPGRADDADSDSSSEVEFGTFLRPSSQHRTLSRPAYSYAYPSGPSSPPLRPTSPPPPDLTSSGPIYLHGKPAQNVPRLRQGAPRLGGLGLGGITSGPPPTSPSPEAKRAHTASDPPPPGSASSTRSSGPPPASTRKLQETLPARPFLSPELARPTPRAGAFALDRAAPDGGLTRERSRSRTRDSRAAEANAEAEPERDGDGDGMDWLQDSLEQVRAEVFEVQQMDEHGNAGQVEGQGKGAWFDRCEAVWGGAEKQGSPVVHELEIASMAAHEDGSDTASTAGESMFATPEMDATSDAENGADIPALTLDVPTAGTTAQPENAPLDGPVQLAASEDDEANSPTSHAEAASLVSRHEADSVVTPSISSFDLPPLVPDPIDSSRAFYGEYKRRSVSPSTLAEALLARAEKSVSAPSSHESPSPSLLLSTTTSPTPSIYGRESPSTDMSRASSREGPPPPRPVRLRPPSMATSRSQSLPRRSASKFSHQYSDAVGGNSSDARHPADRYPSPPSSPAISNGPSDLLLCDAESGSTYLSSINPRVRDPAPPVSPPLVERQQAPALTLPAAERAPEPRRSSSSSSFLSKSPKSSVPSVPSTTPFRRASYQGLGLRLPSSILPKDKATVSDVATSSLALPELSEVPPPDRAKMPPSTLDIQPPVVPKEQPSRRYSTARASTRQVGGYSSAAASLISERNAAPRDAPPPSTNRSSSDASSPSTALPTLSEELNAAPDAHPPPLPPAVEPSAGPATVDAALSIALPNSSALHASSPAISQPCGSTLPMLSPLPTHTAAASVDLPPIAAKTAPATTNESAGAGAAGVVVDVGVAVVGTLVMGGLAVSQAAWKGLAGGWSALRSGGAPFSQVEVVEETVEVQDEAVQAELDDEAAERERERRVVKELVREELGKDRREETESSVIPTTWGDAEFEAPEGFLEEFKQAMAEIGEEDLAANEQAERDAQHAAYAAASRQHDEATFSEVQRTLVFPSGQPAKSRPTSLRSLPRRSRVVISVEGDSEEGNAAETELMDLLSPMWDSPDGGSRRVTVVEQSARHDYAASPGLAESTPVSRTISPTSVLRSPSFSPSVDSFASSGRQPPQPSRSAKNLFKLGQSASKKEKKDGKTPSASIAGDGLAIRSAGTHRHGRTQSLASAESLDDKESKSSGRSSSHQRRRRSMFIFGSRSSEEQIPPVPSLEGPVADTAYVHYGTGATRRRVSDASIPTGLYASRDPYLLSPDPNGPSSSGAAAAARPSATLPRRSSLRQISRYDSSSCSRSSAGSNRLDPYDKKLYRVRFGNAQGGLGLRSVAEDEAERAGGGSFPMAWVGVGRGRYGNLTLKTDEESDELYAEQVAQIKKRWRAFGSHQGRDWAAVKIE
ncbi:hypothetical protein JCM21900_001557 [Sporobolomyces salmonicolor]